MAEGADVHMSANENSQDSVFPLAKKQVPVGSCAKVAHVDEPKNIAPSLCVVGVITESREALQEPITESQGKTCAEMLHNGGVNFESLEDALDDLEHDGALEDWHYYWLMQQGELP